MVERGTLQQRRAARYAGWDRDFGSGILAGSESLESLEARVAGGEIDPRPVSGQQELFENLVNQRVWSAK